MCYTLQCATRVIVVSGIDRKFNIVVVKFNWGGKDTICCIFLCRGVALWPSVFMQKLYCLNESSSYSASILMIFW